MPDDFGKIFTFSSRNAIMTKEKTTSGPSASESKAIEKRTGAGHMQEKKSTSFERMKQENLDTVFRAVVEHKPISRIEIAHLAGLNKVTVTNCVKSLTERGILVELGTTDTPVGVGKPPIALGLNPLFGVMIGVELNIISCKVLATDFNGKVLSREIVREIGHEPDRFVDYITEYVRRIAGEEKEYKNGLLGVGIAIPGNYNYQTGRIEYIPDMYAWTGYPLMEKLTERLPEISVCLQNAAQSGCMGELEFGKNYAFEDMAYIHGAMGLALSVYSNDNYVGHRGFSSRFGHNIIEIGGRHCACGNSGCLEMYASTHAICNRLYPGCSVDNALLSIILLRKQQKDPEVAEALQECIHYLAIGLANIANCFNPQHICIGNYLGMLLAGEEKKLNCEMNQYLLPRYRNEKKIFLSSLGEWSAALGIAACVRDSAWKQPAGSLDEKAID